MAVVLPVTSYSAIQIDQREITQALLNIEDKKRSNLFAWNGQFSPQFIEALLEQYARQNYVVADPFVGSGTVLYECARKGIAALGNELNPSAYYMAKIYELCRLSKDQRVLLIQYLNKKIAIISVKSNPLELISYLAKNDSSPTARNVVSLIVVLLDLFNNQFSIGLLLEKWNNLRNIIMSLPFSNNNLSAILGDARRLSIQENEIDLIITSPPYINVFNYHQKYRRSVESLGYDVLRIARKEIGANRKNRGNRFLTVIEYCVDMSLAIKEMLRISKKNARIIFVVGRESNVLATPFSNSELIYGLACEVHGIPLILKQQRVFKNKYGQMIYEDILHFENVKTDDKTLSEDTLLQQSRFIAVKLLNEKFAAFDSSSKNYPLLRAAIRDAQSVMPSERR